MRNPSMLPLLVRPPREKPAVAPTIVEATEIV
jgi:hypothetical protein